MTAEYRALLFDPPWAYRTWAKKDVVPTRRAVQPYPTMRLPELKKLPIGDMAAKNSVLFMWILDTHMPQALALGEAWGFHFKTVAFTWVKLPQLVVVDAAPAADTRTVMGMGHWTRHDAEQCLLFTRGRPGRLNADVKQTMFAPRRQHSRKPDEIYRRIERLVGGPYLEGFATQRWPGWDQWGNEVGKYEPAVMGGGVGV